MNEDQTKYELINPALRAAGWDEVPGSKVRLEFPINKGRILGRSRRARPLKADYVLEYRNRRLAVIEAKARDKYYSEGAAQAKDYGQRLNIRFVYATNGRRIYGMDLQEGTEGDVDRFPGPEELWQMTFPDPQEAYKKEIAEWKRRFDEVPYPLYKGKYQPYYYQRVAIEKVLDAIASKQERLLLTMATGTGKTATAFHICWKLFEARWNLRRDGSRRPRILFLADRNILADQAFNAFSAFEEDALVRISPAAIRKKGRIPTNGSLFFTIFQTFMSGPDGSPYFGAYDEDFFDFIIIDECHRGGANDESSWRDIMEHFSPAVQLGLTATPKRDVNADTYNYFGEPIYTYALKEGINDGFLTPFKVREIQTTLDEYTYLGDDDVVEGEVEQGQAFTEDHFNRIIEIREREAHRVKLLLEMIDQKQKTLVFCATQEHAAAVRDLINQQADSKNPNYCVRVTANDGAIGEQYLRDFQDNEKRIPTVLTTSRKLSTGVDAPEVRNIALMRPVKSMVEFKQIVGRGTRLYDGKAYFTIYDFVKAHEHFKDPEWDGEPQEPEPRSPYERGKDQGAAEEPAHEPTLCPACQNDPCVCDTPPREMIRVRLSPQKVLEIDAMVKTTFWSPEGQPISAAEFLQQLYGDLPALFESEEALRRIWRLPTTRRKLLEALTEKGYSETQLEELRSLIHGEDSDLFDVLSHIAYEHPLMPRAQRAAHARIHLNDYNAEQQAFLNFVLDQYIQQGITELDEQKLPDLLTLKYHGLADAKRALGEIPAIRELFIGFQGALYEEVG